MLSSNAFLKEVIFFSLIDVESASKQIAGKHRILTTIYISGSCVIHIVIVLWLPFPSVWPL